jgi:uncharacterized protein (TIGR03000 family)
MRKFIVASGFLALAALLLAADTTQARPGGGGGGGAHVGGGYGGGYRGGYYGGRGYWGGGLYFGIGGYPYYGYPYGYGYALPYSYPAVIGGAPLIASYPPLADAPPPQPSLPTPPVVPSSAQFRVIVPDDAVVLFDGQRTNSSGPIRLFHTPPLAPSGVYNYQIRATWMQGGKEFTQQRIVPANVGQTTVVDFTQPESEPLPPPAKIK